MTQTDGNAITGYRIASGSLPNGLALNAGTGAISGTPTVAGSYTVMVQAQDADGWSNTDQVVFTVAPAPNTAPVAGDVTVASATGITVSHNLAADISDAQGAAASLTIVVVTPPSHGTLAWTGTSFTLAVEIGYTGNDTFTYKARDSGGLESAVKTVTLTALSN